MSEYEAKLRAYIMEHGIDVRHLSFNQSTHSVEEASRAVGAEPQDFVKSICMITGDDDLVVAIVKGEDRASTSRVSKALGVEGVRVARPEEILEKTGYPVGGTPAFGYPATFLMDPRVMERDLVYSGGGSDTALMNMAPREMLRANDGKVVRVRK
jgi:Cys-tRNA(Pro)/Cys-tRNA(Cys) deacylase